MTNLIPYAATVTGPLTNDVPVGAAVIPLAEEITAWVVDTFPANSAYLAWYDQLPPGARSALSWVAGVLDKVDAGWPVGTIETAHARTTAQGEMEALYDVLTAPRHESEEN